MPKKAKDFDLIPMNMVPSSSGLQRYIQMTQSMPYLTAEEEQSLAKELRDDKSRRAAEVLVSSHLRLVVKVAYDFRHYGLPLGDLISEGNIGLMTAVKKFDPDKGFRLTTYALWWIKAMMQDYILASWSNVKISSASAQKKLFFGLKRVKEKLGIYDERQMTADNVKKIAKELDVKESEVQSMNAHMTGDLSLNRSTKTEDSKAEYMDFLQEEEPNQEEYYADKEIRLQNKKMLHDGLAQLNAREREIITARQLDSKRTLRDLAAELNISAERVRQIENSAFKKLKKFVLDYNKKQALPDVKK